MNDFEETLKIAGSDLVQLSSKFDEQFGKKLRLGHTDWLVEHGILGEGHEHIHPASRYFQAYRELYNRSNSMIERECSAMEAQADYLSGKMQLETAKTDIEKLRAKARIKRAQLSLRTNLVAMKDLEKEMRKLDQVRKELEPMIEQRYGGDIEKAQPDIWDSKLDYRLMVNGPVNNIPLPLDHKAKKSAKYNRSDGVAAFVIENKSHRKTIKLEANKNNNPLLGDEK